MLLLHVSLELMCAGTYAGFAIFASTGVNRCLVSDIDAAEIQLASNVLTLYLQDVIRKEFPFRHQIDIN